MFMNSVTLFVRGRLFQDLGHVLQRLAIGVAIGVVILVGLAKFGLPLWLCVGLASLVSGAVQPALFKDLKYA